MILALLELRESSHEAKILMADTLKITRKIKHKAVLPVVKRRVANKLAVDTAELRASTFVGIFNSGYLWLPN